jgi:hypothetical protein
MGKVLLCNHCGFPVTRGKLPIIFPGKEGYCKPYCSVKCFEAVAGYSLPEPMRSQHLAVEQNQKEVN